jgi:HEAT repeat protein
LGEAYGEYYVDLALFVAGLKDARSINALTKVMDVAGRISTTLAEFGDAAVQPVIAQLDSPTLRSDAIFTLGKFVQGSRNGRSPVSPANVQTIRQLLLKFARDPSPLARESAAEALQYFKNDSEVVRTLQDLADNDPYSRGKDLKTNTAMFPVRRAAKAALTEATK